MQLIPLSEFCFPYTYYSWGVRFWGVCIVLTILPSCLSPGVLPAAVWWVLWWLWWLSIRQLPPRGPVVGQSPGNEVQHLRQRQRPLRTQLCPGGQGRLVVQQVLHPHSLCQWSRQLKGLLWEMSQVLSLDKFSLSNLVIQRIHHLTSWQIQYTSWFFIYPNSCCSVSIPLDVTLPTWMATTTTVPTVLWQTMESSGTPGMAGGTPSSL